MKLENIMVHFPRKKSDETIDLKTINLDEEDFVCKIVDFGLTRKLEHSSLSNSYVGTPQYMAPNVLL